MSNLRYVAPAAAACVAITVGALCGYADYSAALAGSAAVVGLVIVLSVPSVIPTILPLWFITTPLISFLIQIPSNQPILTYDRIVLSLFAGVLLIEATHFSAKAFEKSRSDLEKEGWIAGSKSSSNSHSTQSKDTVNQVTADNPKITRFEIVWALLSAVAAASVAAKSENLGYSTRILIDSFCLPLIAFHAARRYWREISRSGLVLGVMALSFFLFTTGAYEFLSGSDLFPYRGAAIVRESEIRVNGPFASDSSYAIICLLIALFLRSAPRAFGIQFDRGGRLALSLATASAIVASLLPLYRVVAVSLVVCWLIAELTLAIPKSASSWHHLRKVLLVSGPLIALALALVVTVTTFAILLDGTSIAARVASPRNLFGRLATWETAAKITAENPTFGIGLMNYKSHFDAEYSREEQWATAVREARPAAYPHSNLFWIASELGVPGLGLYLMAAFYLFRSGFRGLKRAESNQQRAVAGCYLSLLAAYWIPGLTLTSGAYSDLNLCFFFLIGILSTSLAGLKRQEQ